MQNKEIPICGAEELLNKKTKYKKIRVTPTQLIKKRQAKEVLINRIYLNSKLVEFQIKGIEDPKKVKMITRAITNMLRIEQEKKCILTEAKMKFKDFMIVFPEYKKLPAYSYKISKHSCESV